MLLLMTTLAQAGELEITVIDGEEELSATLTGLAACEAHELRLGAEEGEWSLRFRVQELDGAVQVDADVRRWAGPRELQLAPSLLLEPGVEGAVMVDEVELIVVASGFEGQRCVAGDRPTHTSRSRSRTRTRSD